MRTFEIITLALLTMNLLWPLIRSTKPPKRLLYLPLFITLIHLFLEGYRWQMVPAYLLTFILAVLAYSQTAVAKRIARLALASGWLLLLIAILIPILLPVPQLMSPTGPYAIGTQTIYLNDPNRLEIYTEAAADTRELMIQIWYPADPQANNEPAPYIAEIDIAGPAIAQRLDLPRFLFSHINLVTIDAFVDAPIAEASAPYPVIIFSHGLQGFRNQNTGMVQNLVSHGFVVITIDHTYANVWSVFPDGRITFYRGDTIFTNGVANADEGTQLVTVWAQDIAFVLDQLTLWNGDAVESLSPFNGRLNLNQVGVFGHSTGGGATTAFCAQDSRCQAGVALDGWLLPVADEFLAQGPTQPFMFINTPVWLGENNAAQGQTIFNSLPQSGYLVTVEGMAHYDFTDLPLFSPLTPQLQLSGSINSQKGAHILNDYLLAFFQQYLQDQPSALLAGENRYPEVTLTVRNE